jgi:hypothetical protein
VAHYIENTFNLLKLQISQSDIKGKHSFQERGVCGQYKVQLNINCSGNNVPYYSRPTYLKWLSAD